MADFSKAFAFTMENEDSSLSGAITNDPSAEDASAQARFGINSAAHPEAVTAGLYKMSRDDAYNYASHFYEARYWRPIMGPVITDQALANKFFDLAVNAGIVEATKLVQRGINLAQGIDTLEVDGKAGPKTLIALNSYQPPLALLNAIKEMAMNFYEQVACVRHWPDVVKNALIARARR